MVVQPPSGIAPSGQPAGSVAAEAVIAANGSLTLTGLSTGSHYVAWTQIESVDRYVNFYIPTPLEQREIEAGTGIVVEQDKVSVTSTIADEQSRAEAAEKAIASGLSARESVALATTGTLPANAYAAGVLTASGNGALSVDGVAVTVGMRLLVKNEVAEANNGLYVVSATGAVGAKYVLTRTTDMNTGAQVKGAFVLVSSGATLEGYGFTVGGEGPFTLGTTAIRWIVFSVGAVIAGTGLAKVGNTLTAVPEEERAKTAEGLKLAKAENLKDLASAVTARLNLGLGSAALESATAFDVKGAAAECIPLTQKGAASGVATLDGTTKLTAAQIPSSVLVAGTATLDQLQPAAANMLFGTHLFTFGSGDLVGAAVTVPPAAHVLDVRNGTAASPTKIGVTVGFSRVDSTSRAELNEMGPEGTDGPDGATVLRAAIKGAATNQVQICAVVASAWQTSTYEGNGNDACPVYSKGRVSEGGTGRAIGAYIESLREGVTSRGQQAVELRLNNSSGVADAFVVGGPSKSMGVWINAGGNATSATAFQVGHAFGQVFETGFGFNEGSITGSTLRDETESTRSFFIRGKHSKGSLVVAPSAGTVTLGVEEPTSGTHLLELFNNGTADPIAKIGSGAAGASSSVEWHNAAAQMKVFISGGTNAFLSGTVNGDSGINFTPGKTFHIGTITHSGMLRISETGLGFYGTSPVARSAAYTLTYSTTARVHQEPELATNISVTLVTELDTELNKTNKAVNELKKLQNAVIKDFQANGLLQ